VEVLLTGFDGCADAAGVGFEVVEGDAYGLARGGAGDGKLAVAGDCLDLQAVDAGSIPDSIIVRRPVGTASFSPARWMKTMR